VQTEAVLAERDVIGNDGPPGRVWLIALDNMSAENALRTRHVLRAFIEQHFGPQDTAAVVLVTRGPRDSGQEFTTNPRLLLNAIDRFTGGDTEGGRLRNFVGDFRALMSFLATLPGGRKSLIFVSENIPVDPDQVMTYRGGRLGRLFSAVEPDFLDESIIGGGAKGSESPSGSLQALSNSRGRTNFPSRIIPQQTNYSPHALDARALHEDYPRAGRGHGIRCSLGTESGAIPVFSRHL
jgi:hypothetical protein